MKTFTEADVANILDCAKIQADMLKERIAELEDVIKRALKISDLWLPDGEWKSEYEGEAQALANMHSLFKNVLY